MARGTVACLASGIPAFTYRTRLAGWEVEAVDAVGGGDPDVDSVIRVPTRVCPAGLAPRGWCRVVRGLNADGDLSDA
jgi:hypothetical protein